MREKKFNSKSFMKKLDKDGYTVIEPLCIDCLMEIEQFVIELYVDVIFKVEQIEDHLYKLSVIL
jgi:hypothetical protein